MRKLFFGLLCLGVFAGGVVHAEAAAAPAGVRIVWDAPSGCPTSAEVEDEIGRLLSSSPSAGEGVSANAAVTRSAKGWSVVLTTDVRGDRGRRSLTASTCEALAHATAIVLALTIDPNANADAKDETEVSPTADAAAPPVAVTEDGGAGTDERPPVPVPPPSTMFAVGANVALAFGLFPSLAVGPEIDAAWALNGWRVEASAAYFAVSDQRIGWVDDFEPNSGGSFRLVAAAARGCKLLRWNGGELGPCIAFEGGVMTAEGFGVRHPESRTVPWFAARGGGRVALELGSGPLWVVLAGDAEVPLFTYRFVLDALGSVHHVNGVIGRAALGAEVRFE